MAISPFSGKVMGHVIDHGLVKIDSQEENIGIVKLRELGDIHSEVVGIRSIRIVGEYLEPKDRRKFLLQVSYNIREVGKSYFSDRIYGEFQKLGYQGPKPCFLDRVFTELTLEEIEAEVFQTFVGDRSLNKENTPHLSLIIPKSRCVEIAREVDEIIQSYRNRLEQRDGLLCKIINDPNTPKKIAEAIPRFLSDGDALGGSLARQCWFLIFFLLYL